MRILFDPAANQNSGGDPNANNPAATEAAAKAAADATKKEATSTAQPPVLDLTAKIKVGGKEMTVAEVAAAVEGANAMHANVAAIFSAGTDPQARQQAVADTLRGLGATDAQVQQYLQENFKEAAPSAGEQINQRLAGLEGEHRAARARELNGKLEQELTTVLDTDPSVKVLLDAAKRLGGDEQVAKAKVALRKALRKETLGQFRVKNAQTGSGVDESWIAPGVKAALTEAIETCGAVIGDANRIGRSAETDAGIQQFVGTQPVKEPKYDAKSRPGTLDEQLEAWLTDGLARDAASVGSGDSRV